VGDGCAAPATHLDAPRACAVVRAHVRIRVGLNGPWRVAERVQLIPGKGGCLQLNDSAVRVQLNFQLNDCSAERSAERSAEQTEHDETDRLNG
jgi:hypothetical protein